MTGASFTSPMPMPREIDRHDEQPAAVRRAPISPRTGSDAAVAEHGRPTTKMGNPTNDGYVSGSG